MREENVVPEYVRPVPMSHVYVDGTAPVRGVFVPDTGDIVTVSREDLATLVMGDTHTREWIETSDRLRASQKEAPESEATDGG